MLYFQRHHLLAVGVPVYLSVLAAALLAVLLGLLSIQEAYRSVEWEVIFFIAGMYVASLGDDQYRAGVLDWGKAMLSLLTEDGPTWLGGVCFPASLRC